MKTRKLTLSLMAVLVLAMVLGFALSSVVAKPPTPATYKCINQDTYFCVMVSANPFTECCTWYESGCNSGTSWYWYTDQFGNTYTCTGYGGTGTCILHNCD